MNTTIPDIIKKDIKERLKIYENINTSIKTLEDALCTIKESIDTFKEDLGNRRNEEEKWIDEISISLGMTRQEFLAECVRISQE